MGLFCTCLENESDKELIMWEPAQVAFQLKRQSSEYKYTVGVFINKVTRVRVTARYTLLKFITPKSEKP